MSYFCRHHGDADDMMSKSIGLSSWHREIAWGKIDIPGKIKTNIGYKVYELIAWHKWAESCWLNLPTLTAQSREQGWDAGLLGGPGGCRRLVGALHMSLCPLHCVATLPWQPVTTPGLMIHPEWCNMRTWKTSRLPDPPCVSLSPEASRSSQISSRSAYTS